MNRDEGWVCLHCADEKRKVWPSIGEQLVWQICHECKNAGPCMRLKLIE